MPKETLIHFSPLAAIGGCEVNCLRVLEGLAGYDHQVVVFDERGPMSDRWAAAGAKVEHLRAWRKGRRPFQTALAEWAQGRAEPRGVFYWSTSRLPFVLDVLRGWSAPWAVHLGNPVAGNFTARARRVLQEYTFLIPPNITLVACSGHVAVTHQGAAYFRRFPIKTVYNPVGRAFDRPRVHRSLPIGSGPRVGMVARLDSIKDHVTLIRALAAIKLARADVILELAGAGDLQEFLLQEADRMGVTDRVRFLGSVTDVADLIAGWDIYLHSTTEAEGMGTAVAEAMMAGLPCVVSDIAVMREVCGQGAAIYARPADPAAWGDALLKLIGNREQRAAMGDAAQNRARDLFALSEVAVRYLRTIRPNGTKELS